MQALKGDESGVVNVIEPHPNFPILATSGLDSDIKIWSPTSETPNAIDNLADVNTIYYFFFVKLILKFLKFKR